MMEIYLNVAEWGPGIYGIEAAAQHHFKVPAAKLSSRQAALLAVSYPIPSIALPASRGVVCNGLPALSNGVPEHRAVTWDACWTEPSPPPQPFLKI